MTSMPTIDDRMVVLFRRTGKRRASYRSDRSGRFAGGETHVVLQRSPRCKFHGQGCITRSGAIGICDENLDCIIDFNPGPDPFRL
jgi:hypothetical protein